MLNSIQKIKFYLTIQWSHLVDNQFLKSKFSLKKLMVNKQPDTIITFKEKKYEYYKRYSNFQDHLESSFQIFALLLNYNFVL